MNDLINGGFETLAGAFLTLNCWRLYRHKQVHGVSMVAMGFFTVWGYWNLYYYPSLGQTISFFGGITVMAMNTLWMIMAIYYIRKNKNE